ncbi:hypothetical protein ABK040_014223 [Willaertia magna]
MNPSNNSTPSSLTMTNSFVSYNSKEASNNNNSNSSTSTSNDNNLEDEDYSFTLNDQVLKLGGRLLSCGRNDSAQLLGLPQLQRSNTIISVFPHFLVPSITNNTNTTNLFTNNKAEDTRATTTTRNGNVEMIVPPEDKTLPKATTIEKKKKSKLFSSRNEELFQMFESVADDENVFTSFKPSSGSRRNTSTTTEKYLDKEYIQQVTTGWNFTYFLTNKHRLFALGNNTNGQLGIGTMENKKIISKIPSILPAETQPNNNKNNNNNNRKDSTSSATMDELSYDQPRKGLFASYMESGTSTSGAALMGMEDNTNRSTSTQNSSSTVIDYNNETVIEKPTCINFPTTISTSTKEDDNNINNKEREYPVFITCGDLHSIVLTNLGNCYACGSNKDGQLGIGSERSEEDCFEFTKVKIPNNQQVVQVVCGSLHSLFLTKEKSKDQSIHYHVYGCGNNRFGQLGFEEDDEDELLTPIRIGFFDDLEDDYVIKIYCGGAFSLFQTKLGNVYACGWNGFGQLGNGSVNDCLEPTIVPIISFDCKSDRNNYCNDILIDSIYCGVNHTFFLMNNNQIYCCGGNTHGQLGLNDLKNRNNLTENLFFNENNLNILSITCGCDNTLFQTTKGEVYVCGYNYYGQLGLNDFENRKIPTKLNLLSNQMIFSNPYYQLITSLTNQCLIIKECILESIYLSILKINIDNTCKVLEKNIFITNDSIFKLIFRNNLYCNDNIVIEEEQKTKFTKFITKLKLKSKKYENINQVMKILMNLIISFICIPLFNSVEFKDIINLQNFDKNKLNVEDLILIRKYILILQNNLYNELNKIKLTTISITQTFTKIMEQYYLKHFNNYIKNHENKLELIKLFLLYFQYDFPNYNILLKYLKLLITQLNNTNNTNNKINNSFTIDFNQFAIINDRFIPIKTLNEQMNGIIVKCFDIFLQSFVVIKVYTQTFLQENSFDQTMNLIKKEINNENIINILDYGYISTNLQSALKLPFIVLPLANQSLVEKLKTSNYSMNQLLQWFKDICNGIYYLHQHQLFNYNIKPENILFFDNDIKITDFYFQQLSSVNHNNHSSFWLPPEIMLSTQKTTTNKLIKRDKLSSSVDIYSLGCLLYFILTKKLPEYQGLYFFGFLRNDTLQQQLFEFINNELDICCKPLFLNNEEKCNILKRLIISMIQKEKDKRPTLSLVITIIDNYFLHKTNDDNLMKIINSNLLELVMKKKEPSPTTKLENKKEEKKKISIVKDHLLQRTSKKSNLEVSSVHNNDNLFYSERIKQLEDELLQKDLYISSLLQDKINLQNLLNTNTEILKMKEEQLCNFKKQLDIYRNNFQDNLLLNSSSNSSNNTPNSCGDSNCSSDSAVEVFEENHNIIVEQQQPQQ